MKRILTTILLLSFSLLQSFSQFNEEKVENFRTVLNEIATSVDNSGVSISVKVVHADYNKELFSFKPELKLIPASITKLVTSSCAFYKLGPGYNVKTIVYTDDININDGEINGNLYLKGFGDPDLNSSDIMNLATQVTNRQIKRITGNIVSDESYFDTDYYTLARNLSGDTGPSYWPYVNALSFNKNKGYSNPGLSCAQELANMLYASNILLEGETVSGKTPMEAKEIAQISHSIYDVLTYMNKESDNHTAITIFKLLGAAVKSEPGSLKKGQEVVNDYLTQIGVPRYSFEILEGSGLTRYNSVTAEMYITMLKFMYDDPIIFDYFFNSLAVAGKDGTLRNRMIGTEAEGNIYAKTGTLNGVSALSGYAINRDDEILIFYIVMNGFGGNARSIRSVQDDICILLAQFSRK